MGIFLKTFPALNDMVLQKFANLFPIKGVAFYNFIQPSLRV